MTLLTSASLTGLGVITWLVGLAWWWDFTWPKGRFEVVATVGTYVTATLIVSAIVGCFI